MHRPHRIKTNKADSYAVIRIVDTGVGISGEIINRIFEPFYTTKAFSSRRGTGLGLSMVYEMAKEMGAGLSVDSKPGQGSQFYMLLTNGTTTDHSRESTLQPPELKHQKVQISGQSRYSC
jgi:two-component system cell cycle sensor histidine kinase/response regulator CckA